MKKVKKHILMISLGKELLSDPLGDSIDRHISYASKIGKVSMVLFTRRVNHEPKSYKDTFYIYPTNSYSKLHFLFDSFRISKKIIETEKVDLITTQDPFGTGLVGVILKKKFGIPIEIQNHSNFIDNAYWIAEKPILFRFFNLLAKRFVLPQGDVFRMLNTREFEIYKKIGIDEKRIHIIQTPVNIDMFLDFKMRAVEKNKKKKSLNINSGNKVMIWVGRPVKLKRICFLIDVFLELKKTIGDIVLVIIGDLNLMIKKDRKYLEKNRNKGIITPGKIDHRDLPEYYAMADVYLHTSIYEGFGKSIVEAMAAGLPVVVSDTYGPADFIENDQNGFIVKDNNPCNFSGIILKILKNPSLKKKIGNNAKTTVQSLFNREMAINQVVNVWRNIN